MSGTKKYNHFYFTKSVQADAREEIATKTLPAFKNFSDFLFNDYVKHLRDGPGLVTAKGPDITVTAK